MQHPRGLLFCVVLLSLLCCCLVTACSEGDDDDHGGQTPADDDAGDTDDDAQADDDAGDDDFNLSDPLGPGEVRAGQVAAEAELIGGPRARGEIGDYKIYNSRIELIVRAPDKPGVSFATYSGNLIDADRARPPEEPGQDNLQGVDQVVGFVRGFWAQQIEVLSDGADGRAVIRVTGKDGGISFFDSQLAIMAPVFTTNRPVRIVTDYILEPDSDYVTLRTTVFNDSDETGNVGLADMPFWGFDTNTFIPRGGFDVEGEDILDLTRWVGGMNLYGTGVSYALATNGPAGRLFIPYIYGKVIPSVETFLKVKAHDSNSWDRIFIVGDGDTRLIAAALNEHDGSNNYGVLAGKLTLADGNDHANTHIFVFDGRGAGKNYVALLLPNADGEFGMQLAPGQYTLVAQGDGRVDSAPVPVAIRNDKVTDVDVALDAPGYLNIDITGEDDGPLPCRVIFQSGHNADPNADTPAYFFSTTGSDVIPVQPGDYTVTISRGYEYEIIRQNVTIVPGLASAEEISGTLVHSVVTTGWISTEFHIHGAYSTDSETRQIKRVTQFAAENLEMPVITEHDYIAPYGQYVAEAGLSDWIDVITGAEISPAIGHFNAWPLTPNASLCDFYGLPYMLYDEMQTAVRNYEFPELWDFARELYGAQAIQINHPADWFDYVGYDLAVGIPSADPDRFGTNFDAMEVWNGTGFNTANYWFSFLDQGLNVTLHGNSDSHSYSPSGFASPRDLVAMPAGSDEIPAADVQKFIDSDLAHHTQLTSGPMIDFTIADQGLGETVIGLGSDQVPLRIVVKAPSWVHVDYVRVYSNHGEIVYEEGVAETTDIVRFDDTVVVEADQDAYFVVETGHTTVLLGPVTPNARTFAITNPICVDIDGNGVFDPPGVP